jgi:hypothetical protein
MIRCIFVKNFSWNFNHSFLTLHGKSSKAIPEDVLASRVSGEPRGDLRVCVTLLPFSLHQHNYYVFLIHHWIQKITSYRMKSSDPCKLYIRKRKVFQSEKTPPLFLQMLLNFHCFLSPSLHLHYSYAF